MKKNKIRKDLVRWARSNYNKKHIDQSITKKFTKAHEKIEIMKLKDIILFWQKILSQVLDNFYVE
jgi:hypothetical protein